jgi:hypothetical protein
LVLGTTTIPGADRTGITLPNGTLDLQGLLATLSSEGASGLHTAVGRNVFTTRQPVGGLTLIVPASSG